MNIPALISPEGRLPYNPKLSDRATAMRRNMTPAEKKFWFQVLKSEKLKNLTFLKQRVIDHYIVDFYCAALKLVIEIDGEVHNEQVEYDKMRTELLEKYGLRVLRFSNEEVMEDCSLCLAALNISLSEGDLI